MGVSESEKQLQWVIDVVHIYCRKWRLKANCAVITSERVLWKVVGSGGNRICQGYRSIHTWALILLRVVHETCV